MCVCVAVYSCVCTYIQDPNAVDCSGNVLLNRLAGAKILLVPPLSYEGSIVDGKQTPGLKHKMQEYMEKLRYILESIVV